MLKTDQQLIDLVAEKVMGWEKGANGVWVDDEGDIMCYFTMVAGENPWNPLTSMDDAWMVVEKMEKQSWSFTIVNGGFCDFRRGLSDRVSASGYNNPGKAICIAALRAIGEDI